MNIWIVTTSKTILVFRYKYKQDYVHNNYTKGLCILHKNSNRFKTVSNWFSAKTFSNQFSMKTVSNRFSAKPVKYDALITTTVTFTLT